MPTTSSYYNDLEYPTVNEDASTYGSIINTYLDGLLTKLKAISDRVTNAQTQLGNINRGVNSVERINTTLAGRIGSSALLPGTGTTLLPDPYSGTYTKTTTWPAYTSELSAYSLPTTQSEVANFDYQGFASALTTELTRIEATVTQAEADILAAQQDTCRTKKIIDVIDAGGSYLPVYQGSGIFGIINYTQQRISSTQMRYLPNSNSTKSSSTGSSTGISTYPGFTEPLSIGGSAQYLLAQGYGSSLSSLYPTEGTLFYMIETAVPEYLQQESDKPLYASFSREADNTYVLTLNYTPSRAEAGFRSGVTYNGFSVLAFRTQTVYGTPDLTECENPSPPYFS